MALELKENENILKETPSDYWLAICGLTFSQTRGRYTFTDQRIHFSGGFKDIDIPYSDIESIKKCAVGPLIPIIPTGIKIVMKNGKKHYLSVMGRAEIMDIIQNHMA